MVYWVEYSRADGRGRISCCIHRKFFVGTRSFFFSCRLERSRCVSWPMDLMLDYSQMSYLESSTLFPCHRVHNDGCHMYDLPPISRCMIPLDSFCVSIMSTSIVSASVISISSSALAELQPPREEDGNSLLPLVSKTILSDRTISRVISGVYELSPLRNPQLLSPCPVDWGPCFARFFSLKLPLLRGTQPRISTVTGIGSKILCLRLWSLLYAHVHFVL